MDLFSVLSLLGGVAIFLFGMNTMGKGLEKSSSGKLKGILEHLTSSPIRAVLLGAGVTAIIQSSSATTVMVVGFVNSGIMKLSQSVGVIMGANIGTTVTSWILSLTGIQSDNVIINLFKPTSLSMIFAIVGIVLYSFSKSNKKKDVGSIMLGFSILLFGMEIMADTVKPLANVPEFTSILTLFSNPILGVLTGAILTAVIQSSSASVGILQAIATTGTISYNVAIPIILGQNIGTCITAILSSIGTNKNARRAAVIHLCFNIIGAMSFLIIFYIIRFIFDLPFLNQNVNPAGIAIVHTIFNLFSTTLLLPFSKQLEKLAYFIIKGDTDEMGTILIDERLIATPGVAIAQCRKLSNEMAELSKNTLFLSLAQMKKYDAAQGEEIRFNEERIDMFEDKLGTYLVKISRNSLGVDDSHEVSNLLHVIGDLERIGDHALNILKACEEIDEKKIVFSPQGQKEFEVYSNALVDILKMTMEAFEKEDLELAKSVEPLEEVIDDLKRTLKKRHVMRLQTGECTIETGFVFSDLLNNLERVADHCSNIAVCLIQVSSDNFDTHEYLNRVKQYGENHFDSLYEEYCEKYYIGN